MAYQFNFGSLTGDGPAPTPKKARKFRLAVLGDFSARANRGELESGEALSKRKPLSAAADNLDDLLERLAPTLRISLPGSGTVELAFASLEDFHPDQLYEKLEIFSQLSSLRSRLKTSATFAKAAAEMRAIGLAPAPAMTEPPPTARGSVLAVNAEISDFARFLGQPTAAAEEEDSKTSLNAFLRGVMAPYVSATKDPQQDKLVAAADAAIGEMMRTVLHHPDFQTLESLWRSLAFLATRLETDETLEVVLLDLSAEEFAADLSAGNELQETALYRILVTQPAEDARAGLFSAIVANYVFERTPAHADLLGRVAMIAAAAHAPFVASVPVKTLDVPRANLEPATRDAWEALRKLPEANYLGLGLPRFLLRLPYGPKTEPIEAFKFEEFTVKAGPDALLWANPAVAVGLLLGETFRQQGDKLDVGSLAGIGELPYYCYEDADGDETAMPCTERLLTGTMQTAISGEGFLPLMALKNSPEIRVGVFRAVGGGLLWGWWAGALPATTAKASGEAAVAEVAPDEAAPAAATAGDAELDALLAGLDTPAAPPPADAPEAAAPAAPADDTELDALLAGLDAPAAPAAAAPGGDSELDALLGDLAASTDPAPAEAAAAPPAGDSELDALLGDLAAPPEPAPAEAVAAAPPAGDAELDALLGDLAAPPEPAPAEAAAAAPPAGDSGPDALLGDLATSTDPVPAEPAPAPLASDAELDALLTGLDASPDAASAEPAAASVDDAAPPTEDPELAALLGDLASESAAAETPPDSAVPADEPLEGDPELAALLASLEPLTPPEEPAPASAAEPEPATTEPATTPDAEGDPELDKLLADLG